MRTETIEIYYDDQEPSDAGWAYRATITIDGETETGPSGSGAIDGAAADALEALCEYAIISDDQRAALAALVDSQGWDRERVTLAGVGPLWP